MSTVRTITPIGCKSIKAVYFENSSSILVSSDSSPLSFPYVSIKIGGRTIADKLMITPFIVHQEKWEDVAINLNMNAELTELIIEWENAPDAAYNIVFVYSDEIVNEIEGFEYFETKIFVLSDYYSESLKAALPPNFHYNIPFFSTPIKCEQIPSHFVIFPIWVDDYEFNIDIPFVDVDLIGETNLIEEKIDIKLCCILESEKGRFGLRKSMIRLKEGAQKINNIVFGEIKNERHHIYRNNFILCLVFKYNRH